MSDFNDELQRKFTPENTVRYVSHLLLILTVDPAKIKFLDECHFVSRSLARTSAVGPVGQRIYVVRDDLIQSQKPMTITLMTSICPRDTATCWSTMTNDMNDAELFFYVLCAAVDAGFLRPGDVLVLDNAPVHKHGEVLSIILDMLDELHICVHFLPAYSPELNACELVFGFVKNSLRNARSNVSFVAQVALLLASLDRGTMASFYRKSILGKM
jgi:hypothetical protein